jgi:hypothetical protein
MEDSFAQLKKNVEYRKLSKSHNLLKRKLEKLNKLRHLSEKDEVERKRLQKLKLKTKDQMEMLVQRERKNGAEA